MANLRLHSLNDVKIVGRLTRDPELRYTAQGTPVCHLRLAVGRRFKDRNSGEWREEVAFVPCSVWRDNAERCNTRLKKGSPVFIEGRLKSRDWQTKEGHKRSDLEIDISRIQFLEMASEGEASGATPEETTAAETPTEGVPATAAVGSSNPNQNDNEVPF